MCLYWSMPHYRMLFPDAGRTETCDGRLAKVPWQPQPSGAAGIGLPPLGEGRRGCQGKRRAEIMIELKVVRTIRCFMCSCGSLAYGCAVSCSVCMGGQHSCFRLPRALTFPPVPLRPKKSIERQQCRTIASSLVSYFCRGNGIMSPAPAIPRPRWSSAGYF